MRQVKKIAFLRLHEGGLQKITQWAIKSWRAQLSRERHEAEAQREADKYSGLSILLFSRTGLTMSKSTWKLKAREALRQSMWVTLPEHRQQSGDRECGRAKKEQSIQTTASLLLLGLTFLLLPNSSGSKMSSPYFLQIKT